MSARADYPNLGDERALAELDYLRGQLAIADELVAACLRFVYPRLLPDACTQYLTARNRHREVTQ